MSDCVHKYWQVSNELEPILAKRLRIFCVLKMEKGIHGLAFGVLDVWWQSWKKKIQSKFEDHLTDQRQMNVLNILETQNDLKTIKSVRVVSKSVETAHIVSTLLCVLSILWLRLNRKSIENRVDDDTWWWEVFRMQFNVVSQNGITIGPIVSSPVQDQLASVRTSSKVEWKQISTLKIQIENHITIGMFK